MDNSLIKEYANLAENAYKEYIFDDNNDDNDNSMVQDLINKDLNNKYNILCVTPFTTKNGFQAVIYGDISTYDKDTNTYGKVIIAYRGSMPPENFSLNEFIQDWINNDFKDIVGGDMPRQFEETEDIQNETAVSFFEKAKNFLTEEAKLNYSQNITVTGHSLGGALAQLTAAKYNLEGYSFNGPGVKYQAEQAGFTGTNVKNFIIMNDIIGNLRDEQSDSGSSGHVGEEYYYFPTATVCRLGFNPTITNKVNSKSGCA